MDADDFLNFLFDGGGGGGGGGVVSSAVGTNSIICDAFAAASTNDSRVSASLDFPLTTPSTLPPTLSSDPFITNGVNNVNTMSGGAKNPFPGFMSLDTPIFESLTDDFFAGLLGNGGTEGGLETIDPDQLLSHCDPTPAENLLDQTSPNYINSPFPSINDPNRNSHSSHSNSINGGLSPHSPPDHTYAGSDDGSGGGGVVGGSGTIFHPNSPTDSSVLSGNDADAENTIFAPYISGENEYVSGGEDTDSNVEAINHAAADDDDEDDDEEDEAEDSDSNVDGQFHGFNHAFGNETVELMEEDGFNGGVSPIYVLEGDLAATEVVMTTVDDMASNASSASSHRSGSSSTVGNGNILVKIIPSSKQFISSDGSFQLDASQVKTISQSSSSTLSKRPKPSQHQQMHPRGSSHSLKRSFITVKTRPNTGGNGRPGSSSSASSTHSEELNFGGASGKSSPPSQQQQQQQHQSYSRKQQQQQQRQYARKLDGRRGAASSASADGSSDSKFPKLELTEEERRLVHQEGISLPDRLPLTKQEERALKGIRRKIRNKQSALASRQKKKTYVDNLESRVKMCSDENQKLLGRVSHLEQQNGSLLAQLKRLQTALQNANKPVHSSTTVMVLLLSFALLIFPNLSPLEKQLPEEFREMLKSGTEDGSVDGNSAAATSGNNLILPGQSRNLLAAASSANNAVISAGSAAKRVADFQEMIRAFQKKRGVPFIKLEDGGGVGGGGGGDGDGAAVAEVQEDKITLLKKRKLHESLKDLGSAGYIIDDDIDDDSHAVPPDAKRFRPNSPLTESVSASLFGVDSVVNKSSSSAKANETVSSTSTRGVDDDDDVVHLDVKPDVDSLDLVFRNNIKNLGLKTYENAYEANRIGRRLLTTETNIIDI